VKGQNSPVGAPPFTLHQSPITPTRLWQAQNIWNHLAHNGTRHWPLELKDPWLRLGTALNIDVEALAGEHLPLPAPQPTV